MKELFEKTGKRQAFLRISGTSLGKLSGDQMMRADSGIHQSNIPPELDLPAYPAAEAARLIGLHPTRVRRWLRGYQYRYKTDPGEFSIREQEALIQRGATRGTTYASFLDLIDLLFARQFLDYGISLQKLRKALDEARAILKTDHFARQTFFTDGRNVYLQVKDSDDHSDAILELLSNGQWVIAPVIRALAHRIEFDKPSGLARRWYPKGPSGLVVLDPSISFGRPSIVGRGVPTAAVYDLYLAERKKLRRVCKWMDLKTDEVQAAVSFEMKIAA
ncbi:MAG: DUF433 domain-containing protein [bacterium]